MNFTTKFKVGQEVWMMYENKCSLVEIVQIIIRVTSENIFERYVVNIPMGTGNYIRKSDVPVEDLHDSKKKLLETI